MVATVDRKHVVAYLQEAYQVSITRGCVVTGLPKSVYYYRRTKDDSLVIEQLNYLKEQKPNRGFSYYFKRMRNQGCTWNHKRVKRVYNLLGLNIHRKVKRRLPDRLAVPLEQPARSNMTWSMDFMHDCLSSGRKVRILNIIDDYNREALCVEPGYSQSGHSLVRCLDQLFQTKGKPKEIRCDNGPEFLSQVFTAYCAKEGVNIRYIQPGKPTQNAYIERFNRSYREDILDAYLFHTLEELQHLSFSWKEDYNANHPHQALNYLSPIMYSEQNQHL